MKSWRRAVLAFALFGGVGLVILFGLPALGLSGEAQARHWLALAKGPLALPAVIAAFAILAFVGVPQVALIAAAVAAFGPWTGAAFSWSGTLVSSLVGFALGRGFGARLIADWPQARQFADLVGRNGFLASLVVRLVPFAPFVLVNITAGVTSMRWSAFALGTALGILPKIAVIAFAGHTVMAGGLAAAAWLALALAVWALAGLAARRWLKR